MSKISVSQAAKLTGKSRETINKATKEGTLSYSLNTSNHKVIDVSELERVYPFVKTMAEVTAPTETVRQCPSPSTADTESDIFLLREKLANSDRINELLTTERERERRQLESEIETLQASLEKSQEQHNKALLLITDQSQQTKDRIGEWEDTIQSFAARLAKHEERSKKEQQELKDRAKRRIVRLQRELEQEQSKSFLQKLFS